jgi:hypothetical protein
LAGRRTTARTVAALPLPRDIRYLDAALAIWIVAWIAIAAVMAASVRQLADFGDTVVAASEGLEETSTGLERVSNGLRQTADGLSTVSALPLVGNLGPRIDRAATEVDRIAARVDEAAAEARRTGQATREDAEDFSVLLGLTIAALGVLPALLMYMLVRPLLVVSLASGRGSPET